VKKQKHKFLNLPQIVGGKEALKKYFEVNLIYPDEAKEKRIEGIVELIAEIDDNGKVIQVEIVKGLEYGCNEEAARLVKNVQFGAVKNRGIRLKTKKRFKIKFQLPLENQIKYHLVNGKKESPVPGNDRNFTYTINLS
jgi:TonB family protein